MFTPFDGWLKYVLSLLGMVVQMHYLWVGGNIHTINNIAESTKGRDIK